jgi:c-di-GMP-binding flagellar brake protein YcgR
VKPNIERRRSMRIPVELRGGWCLPDEEGLSADCRPAMIADLSARGARLNSQQQVSVGSLVTVSVFSDEPVLELHAAATVVRVTVAPGGYQTSVQFENLSPQQTAMLTRFVLQCRARDAAA